MKNTILLASLIFFSVLAFGQRQTDTLIFTNTQCNRRIVIRDTLGHDSLVQEFFSNGQLFYQMPYRDGLQNGWSEQFHRNGAVSGKSLWVNGRVIDGFNIYYWDNGVVMEKGYYKNGHLIGKWYNFSSDGEPMSIYIYNKKGELVKMKDWDEKKRKWVKTSGIR